MDKALRDVVERVLHTANIFLHGMHYEMRFLVSQNPTYEEIAKHVTAALSNVAQLLDAEDPHLADQASEYCWHMGRIGAAIKAHDAEKLRALCNELNKKPFVMPHE